MKVTLQIEGAPTLPRWMRKVWLKTLRVLRWIRHCWLTRFVAWWFINPRLWRKNEPVIEDSSFNSALICILFRWGLTVLLLIGLTNPN